MVWQPSVSPDEVLIHSAKGSTWKNHKYIKKIGSVYVYAKTASKHKRLRNKYTKLQKEAYKKSGSAMADSVSSRMGNPDYNVTTGKDDEKAFQEAYRQGEMATRYRDSEWMHGNLSRRYSKLAKETLASIPKEMLSDGKKLFDSIFKRKKKGG